MVNDLINTPEVNERLEKALAQAEARSGVQIRVVVAKRSGRYAMASVRMSVIVAMLVITACWFFWIHVPTLWAILGMGLLVILSPHLWGWFPWLRWLATQAEVDAACTRAAQHWFFKLGFSDLDGDPQLLFYYSTWEHELVVLGDKKASEQLDLCSITKTALSSKEGAVEGLVGALGLKDFDTRAGELAVPTLTRIFWENNGI